MEGSNNDHVRQASQQSPSTEVPRLPTVEARNKTRGETKAPSNEMEIDKLTEDLLMEILWRLPVKTLLQFKSVCKNWYALIQSPSFIYLHRDRVASIAAAQNTDCLLVKRFPNGGEGGVALSLVPNETPVEDIDISFTGLDILSLQILGSCNGVVCLTKFSFNSNIVLCNLSMKEFRVLPQPSYNNDQCCSVGFGSDPFTNDYKVVRFAMSAAHFTIKGIDETVEIYDLSSDSWREVAAESPIKSGFLCSFDLFASWNGDFYWYANHYLSGGAVIMAFSMTNEVFKEMPVPDVFLFDRHSGKKLTVLNDSLALVIYLWSERCFGIWVMNEDDVEVSWTKKFTIGPLDGINRALGFRRNGEFLVESNHGMTMSYNLNTRERKEYQLQGNFPPPKLEVLLCTESLVSVTRHYEYDGHIER